MDSDVVKRIEEFVYVKPRSIQEIASHIGKNWRTADRYLGEIEKEFGTIAMRTFRGGTKGALKIAYWASVENVSGSVFQKILEEEILKGKKKEEFSAFDIFQHVSDKNKKVEIAFGEEDETDLKELKKFISKAEKQVIIFSGNLSFVNLENEDVRIFEVIEELVRRGVSVKIICRVDISGRDNIEKIMSLNFKHGKEFIEIRHREQPLRAIVVDGKVLRAKEIKEATGKKKELDKKVLLFYTIKDREWVEWTVRVFWKMFSCSVSADKRLGEIEKLKV